MFYMKPHFYDSFACVAGSCPDTCCAGWQIVIDDASLLKYSRVQGGFGNRLLQSIDWEEGAFLQFDGRCSCLNEDNLCDLHQELGEGYLCDTCRNYPRHVEEFDGVRELSLSLSCPEATRIMLTCQEPLHFINWETEEEEPDPDEEFDFLLFSCLNDAREILFQIIQNRREPVSVRMGKCLAIAEKLEQALEEGKIFEIGEELEMIRSQDGQEFTLPFRERKSFYDMLRKLELLREDWGEFLKEAGEILYDGDEETYQDSVDRFSPGKWEQYAEQLLMFFIYTYFNGAVYDEEFFSKAAFAVYSTEIIRDFYVAGCMLGKKAGEELFLETSWRYAREIEHSDQNLERVEGFLSLRKSTLDK